MQGIAGGENTVTLIVGLFESIPSLKIALLFWNDDVVMTIPVDNLVTDVVKT
jgi:hypothetical protein